MWEFRLVCQAHSDLYQFYTDTIPHWPRLRNFHREGFRFWDASLLLKLLFPSSSSDVPFFQLSCHPTHTMQKLFCSYHAQTYQCWQAFVGIWSCQVQTIHNVKWGRFLQFKQWPSQDLDSDTGRGRGFNHFSSLRFWSDCYCPSVLWLLFSGREASLPGQIAARRSI